MWSIACYPSYTPEGGVPRARRIFRRYLPAEILTYLIINFLWAGLSLWLVSTLRDVAPTLAPCSPPASPPRHSSPHWHPPCQ